MSGDGKELCFTADSTKELGTDINFDLYTRPVWKLRPAIVSGRTNAIVSIRMAHDIGWRPWGGRDCR